MNDPTCRPQLQKTVGPKNLHLPAPPPDDASAATRCPEVVASEEEADGTPTEAGPVRARTMSEEILEGWFTDPYRSHEARWLSDARRRNL